MFLIVVYEERGHVVIDLDGHKIELSDMEAREVAHSLLDAAKLCHRDSNEQEGAHRDRQAIPARARREAPR